MPADDWSDSWPKAIEAALEETLASSLAPQIEGRLLEAMRYAVLDGGKRIRPLLVLAGGAACGGSMVPLLPFACAVEMIHAYSLVHDDLPAMDDDDVRRGRPSNHIAFGEAMAILAGDALLTEAFAVTSRAGGVDGVSVESALRATGELATAAGARGMVGGQAGDMLAEGREASIDEVESIHRRKTGALLRASVRMGAIVAGAGPEPLERLTRFGDLLGLAFQVADDILDATGNLAETGKAGARDAERGKSTYPARIGVEASLELLLDLERQALEALAPFDAAADPARTLLRRVIIRATG